MDSLVRLGLGEVTVVVIMNTLLRKCFYANFEIIIRARKLKFEHEIKTDELWIDMET